MGGQLFGGEHLNSNCEDRWLGSNRYSDFGGRVQRALTFGGTLALAHYTHAYAHAHTCTQAPPKPQRRTRE